jgi:DNA replication protein DnaC
MLPEPTKAEGGQAGTGDQAGVPRPRPGEVRASAMCPLGVCDGSGWIVGPEDVARPCECRARRIERARATGLKSALPKRFRGVSFDRPPMSEMARRPESSAVVAEVREFCDGIDENLEQGHGLWLEGSPGTGKTTLAMLVSKAALEAGRTVAIYSMPDLLARIRRTFDTEAGGDSYFTFFNRLISVDLLHLDDLGAENRTEWVLEQLYSIIDRRYNDQRSVVVTTNRKEAELGEQLGERVTSRLVEMCGEPKQLHGTDRRVSMAPAPPLDEPSQPS